MELQWILLIIFAVVWVIGNMVRAQQEEPRTPPARRPPPRNPNANPPTPRPVNPNANRPAPPTVSDIDRFLQDIDRRRRRDAGEPATTAEAAKPKPAPRPASPPPPPPPPPTTTRGAGSATGGRVAKQAKTAKMAKPSPKQNNVPVPPPAPTGGKRAPGDLAVELTLPEPSTSEPKPATAEDRFLEAATGGSSAPASPASGSSPNFPSVKHQGKPMEGSPAELLIALLRSPKGMPVAFVLREILSEPKSKRPPGAAPQQSS